MFGDCDVRVNLQEFSRALRLITPSARRSVKTITLRPAASGIEIALQSRKYNASTVVDAQGPWKRDVIVRGPLLTAVICKFYDEDLRLTYVGERLHINGLGIGAKEIGMKPYVTGGRSHQTRTALPTKRRSKPSTDENLPLFTWASLN